MKDINEVMYEAVDNIYNKYMEAVKNDTLDLSETAQETIVEMLNDEVEKNVYSDKDLTEQLKEEFGDLSADDVFGSAAMEYEEEIYDILSDKIYQEQEIDITDYELENIDVMNMVNEKSLDERIDEVEIEDNKESKQVERDIEER